MSAIAPFALLDDAHAGARLYTDWVRDLTCASATELDQLETELHAAWQDGLHAVLLAPYEFGAEIVGVPMAAAIPGQPFGDGVLRVVLYRTLALLPATGVDGWLEHAEHDRTPAGIRNVHAMVDADTYIARLARIQEYLRAGDNYQVNATFRLTFESYGSPIALYRRLRARQPVPYGACIVSADGTAVLSCSPELFFRQHADGRLEAQPMKGTAPRGADAQADREASLRLAADAKNRAENVMIVDLLRNDLGRVAVPGSVTVPALFEVTPFGRVLQMTSTIQARVRPGTTLADTLRALFPCGSITGAPKRRTMEIIRETEDTRRGLYTGAIGWLAEDGCCLSVAIRTLVLDAPQADGTRRGEMGVGAGIVIDSVPADEYAECLLKARFLTDLEAPFELFETMHVTSAGCALLPRHLARLGASAAAFGIPFDRDAAQAAVMRACAALPEGAHRMRMALRGDGTFSLTHAPLQPIATPVNVRVAELRTTAADLFLRHKTSHRQAYDAIWHDAEAHGAFDALCFNERGELTEGGRTSVFVKRDGCWWTPPLACGLLPGVMRGAILDDAARYLDAPAAERVLSMEDLLAAEAIVLCNALRGVMPARLVLPPSPPSVAEHAPSAVPPTASSA